MLNESIPLFSLWLIFLISIYPTLAEQNLYIVSSCGTVSCYGPLNVQNLPRTPKSLLRWQDDEYTDFTTEHPLTAICFWEDCLYATMYSDGLYRRQAKRLVRLCVDDPIPVG